jgi:hypothetical protein
MKRILLLNLAFILCAYFSGMAQDPGRTHKIGSDKYRSLIENYVPSKTPEKAPQKGGDVLFFENFDGNGPGLPAGWTSQGSSTACIWNVDATPAIPGFYSSPYSLNYNNGVDFDCETNWGWVASPMIPVGGKSFNISFWYNFQGECELSNDCPWDQTYMGVFDEINNLLFVTKVLGTQQWFHNNYYVSNTSGAQNIHIEFYFDTGDNISNGGYGPFIDNLEVKTANAIPVSGWALWIGIALIAAFTVFRLRRQA